MHVQIVKFKLKPDSSREIFLELTEQMIKWLKERRGFISYELYDGGDCWSDRITWENAQAARDALKAFLTTSVAGQLISLVESNYSSFFGEAVATA